MKNFIGLISAVFVGLMITLAQTPLTRWIIEKSVGFTDVGLLRISESVRAYAYLILSSQASARSSIVGNTASALTAQSAFLNNFENGVNQRVNQVNYASSKVDYSVGQNIFMLPSDMKLKIKTGTVRHNNKIIVSDGKFSLGKNDKVNAPTMISTQAAANSNDVLGPWTPPCRTHTPTHTQ